ncbi:anaerobic dimethyl sulfoxide reductase chain B [Sulfuricella denitrificans skB26]|uniref:Anaerobic dimethyl sulfoxide reductase chain B n=1 Tax=Sulfuricella denitrificans (strain DSM 22764 / NBRC 105220 / skB26) TaxID=1163617 RepID=S6AAL7_SULDS|nr:DmsC/YnfH family molybdoenzyme membrane anchor subunit [Sulfuricella denitrificans]BAN36075.1 anaerobic dimethyl sulfoxide reductase chain B [Sulfuricella denitrificans skB26]
MFKVRDNEPDYALLADKDSQTLNRYGLSIDKAQQGDALYGKSLNINGDGEIGSNPNRYKQHGFYFNADNCIACHACEAACSEKNDNPAHIAFRSVGFVEGGTYPNYQRLNISMACNHCDDPVCLKGCPTRAYTKFAEYGAVLQDPDICFGCGYCTWVCPYNAPQLDPVKGQVSKCNMCVDRLEVGLKPACVSACLGKALDFGVIENIPEGRAQAKTEIPGFPSPEITHPNIRFQQTRTTQRDMVRVDSTALKYHRDDTSGAFRPTLDPKHGYQRHWNLKKLLGSHENAHIAFTLSVQTVMGAFLLLILGGWLGNAPLSAFGGSAAYLPLLGLMLALMSFGLFKLNMHLGKPLRFYRGFNNLRHSPVSREIAGVSLFFAGLAGYGFFTFFGGMIASLIGDALTGALRNLAAGAGILGAGLGGYYMIKLYLIPARPFWNHWHTGAAFVATALGLGALLLALTAWLTGALTNELGVVLASVAATGFALEGIGLIVHARDLKAKGDEGMASFYEQTTTYGYPYWLRNGLLATSLMLALGMGFIGQASGLAFAMLTLTALTSGILGRALFYVLVIPTTMPGAFFWRNKGFVEHAKEVGLANMPQVGVVPDAH